MGPPSPSEQAGAPPLCHRPVCLVSPSSPLPPPRAFCAGQAASTTLLRVLRNTPRAGPAPDAACAPCSLSGEDRHQGTLAGLPLSQPQRFPREASPPQRAPSGRPVAKKPRTVWGQEHCSCSLPSRPGAGSGGRGSQRCPGQCQPVTGEHRDLKHLARLGRPAPCSLASLHFLGLHLHDPLTSPRQTLKMTLERPV